MLEGSKDPEERSDGGQPEDVGEGGSVTVDEPTDTSLDEHNDEGFRDGVPEPGTGESDQQKES